MRSRDLVGSWVQAQEVPLSVTLGARGCSTGLDVGGQSGPAKIAGTDCSAQARDLRRSSMRARFAQGFLQSKDSSSRPALAGSTLFLQKESLPLAFFLYLLPGLEPLFPQVSHSTYLSLPLITIPLQKEN